MPALSPDDDIGLAFDMHGCPNRCRHCWLDHRVVTTPRTRMSEEDVRWAVSQFRAFRRPGEDRAPWKRRRVQTWIREPDYSDSYRELHALASELADVPPERGRMELLSAWRLARDPEYAPWGHDLGVRECQITFFGLEKATDWGVRRRGAFRDLLEANERLLAAGIRPRWQLFFTKMILPDLPGLIALAEELRMRERCEALGGPFTFWMHIPSADGAALDLDPVWPEEPDVEAVPLAFREHCEAHTRRPFGLPERVLFPRLCNEPGPAVSSISDATSGHPVWFYVASNLDVYPSFSGIWPATRLGNLRTDGVAALLDVWEHDRTEGLQAFFVMPTRELAQRYGRPDGRQLYDTDDLQWRWAALHARNSSRWSHK